MIRIFFIAIILCTVIVGCVMTPSVNPIKLSETRETVAYRQRLIGLWKGEVLTRDGGRRAWIMQRFRNGTYCVSFRIFPPDNKEWQQTETGLWGISGGVYFMLTRGFLDKGKMVQADVTDPTLYDAYRIISLTNHTFEYENFSTKERYRAQKVGQVSAVPDQTAAGGCSLPVIGLFE